jgi:hypothetical protein
MGAFLVLKSLRLHIVAYLLKARTVEAVKQLLLGNAARNNRGSVKISDVTFTAVAVNRMGKNVRGDVTQQ